VTSARDSQQRPDATTTDAAEENVRERERERGGEGGSSSKLRASALRRTEGVGRREREREEGRKEGRKDGEEEKRSEEHPCARARWRRLAGERRVTHSLRVTYTNRRTSRAGRQLATCSLLCSHTRARINLSVSCHVQRSHSLSPAAHRHSRPSCRRRLRAASPSLPLQAHSPLRSVGPLADK